MTGDFDNVFARETMRGTEEGDNDFIEDFAVGGVDDLAEGGGVRLSVKETMGGVEGLETGIARSDGQRAADSYDCYASDTRGGGDGEDGIQDVGMLGCEGVEM